MFLNLTLLALFGITAFIAGRVLQYDIDQDKQEELIENRKRYDTYDEYGRLK